MLGESPAGSFSRGLSMKATQDKLEPIAASKPLNTSVNAANASLIAQLVGAASSSTLAR